MYASALISANSTTKPESAGLLAHMFSVLQLAKDLGGSQWLHYGRPFREWVAAKKHKDLGRTKLADILSVLPVTQPLESGPEGSLAGMSDMELQESVQEIRM